MPKPCKHCQSELHTSIKCFNAPRKPIKRSVAARKVKKVVKKPKAKKSNKKALKLKLEKLVKEYVKKRDDYTCQRCGKRVQGFNCHASHVIPVSRSGYLQFEPLNMKVLCYHDHINWWHKHPIEAGKWFTDKFPDRWDYLQNLHIQRLKPMKEDELQEKIEEYTKKLLQL